MPLRLGAAVLRDAHVGVGRFFQGSNKEGIGYNENQFSLPRAQQLVITRATLFEGTFLMPPTAGWSFVPLVPYHAGGGAASFWPPSAHLQEYELAIAMHMAYGVAACYRGPGLYDTPAVRDMVRSWVSWFKQYRRILTSDIIHVRRPADYLVLPQKLTRPYRIMVPDLTAQLVRLCRRYAVKCDFL